ncbi:MAG: hypothetical protein A2Y62_18990 [Candidatus Fischerbacteria bacterium RBG_13_37_8]|uniref:Response regulatory domain-containing protein n=1 Tax=Candidatus Fischerbacteria bacterium RBG_13_37_8 TaxID=1817863 RepID=A0A1F5VK82_9BACT|nr:MAG: hypothetical protein A2Y62_18990 [Candidatus Fischerbacteria bacterium RBG_13_37_8]
MKECRILIVDSDRRFREDLVSALIREGYYVTACKCLTEALKCIVEVSWHCIILDVILPEMKGYEAASIIKNIDPNITIIMTTEINSKELEAKVREQKIYYYFIKSFNKEEIMLAINCLFPSGSRCLSL